MSFVGEISAQLRADNSDFKAKLADADKSVQVFGRQLSGLAGRFSSGAATLGQFAGKFGAIGAAIAGAVASGKLLLDRIRESKEGINENVDAAKRFVAGVDDISQGLKSVGGQILDVGVKTVGIVNSFGEWIGRGIAILKNGREQVELSERIEKQTEETLALLERQRAAAAEIGRLRALTADVEKRTSDEATKLLGIDERRAIVRRRIYEADVAAQQAGEDKVKAARADLELAQARSELQKLDAEVAKQIAAEEKRAADERAKAHAQHITTLEEIQKLKFEALPLEEKILTYTESIANLERMIAEGKKAGANVDEYVLALMENQIELARLRDEKAVDLTETEKMLLALSKEQLGAQRVIVESAIAEAKARGESTAELERQLSLINEILGVSEKVVNTVIRIGRTGSEYEDQSTSALKGVLAKNRSNVQRINEREFQTGMDNPFDTLLGAEILRIQSELSERGIVSSYAARNGEEAARRQFGDTATDKALRDMQDTNTRTSRTLDDIHQLMKRVFSPSPVH